MSVRRWCAALFAALSIVYLRYTMPVFDESVVPALRLMLRCEQVTLFVPTGTVSWLGWD